MTAFYNEHDRFAAAWLRELITDGLIAPGIVDERSIEDLAPSDLDGFRQCHFFAGIGVWSLALRRAGWADDRPIWTASCPCQPFSAAGKGGGFADERHLWPALGWLVRQCRPAIIVGEQVSSDDGLAWIDVVLADLDNAGYTCGALDTCAAGFGAPHIRQRLYWMGIAASGGCERVGPESAHRVIVSTSKDSSGMAHAGSERRQQEHRRPLGDEDENGRQPNGDHVASGVMAQTIGQAPTNGLWRNADWLGCRDGKWRPVSPGTFPLAATGTVRYRVGMLRCAGNALNLAQAESFVRAVMDTQ